MIVVSDVLRKASSIFALTILLAGIAASVRAAEEAAQVILETALGDITIEVYPEAAPARAGDFLTYTDRGLYDGAEFYRAVSPANDNGSPVIEVLQGGLPGDARSLAPVTHEDTRRTGLTHTVGAVSLARGEVGTGSAAAFFIVLRDEPGLDYGGKRNPDGQGFAVFGRVIGGMDVVRRIHGMPKDPGAGEPYVRGQLLVEPVIINRARRVPANSGSERETS